MKVAGLKSDLLYNEYIVYDVAQVSQCYLSTILYLNINCIYKIILKVMTNEKRGGLKVVAFDRSSFKLFSLRSQPNLCMPHPVRGLKLLSEHSLI